MTTNTLMPCPKCKGEKGQHTDFYGMWMDCTACDGTGRPPQSPPCAEVVEAISMLKTIKQMCKVGGFYDEKISQIITILEKCNGR